MHCFPSAWSVASSFFILGPVRLASLKATNFNLANWLKVSVVVFDAFMSIFADEKWAAGHLVWMDCLLFSIAFSHLLPQLFERCAYIRVLIYQNRNHIIKNNKTESRAFLFPLHPFVHCFQVCLRSLLDIYIFAIRNFRLTESLIQFYLFILSSRSPRERASLFYGINVFVEQNRTNVRIWTSTVAAKSSNLIKRIFWIFLLPLFHSIFEREHFDF